MSNENTTSPLQNTWTDLITNLPRGRSGDDIAVHRPLLILLLLARARRKESNRVAFCDIEKDITEAIKRFGPAANPGGAELPFWHLKNSGVWVIENEEDIPLQKDKNRPTKGTLIDDNVTGQVPPLLWQALIQSEQLIDQLASLLVETYWTGPDQREAVLRYFGLPITLAMHVEGEVA